MANKNTRYARAQGFSSMSDMLKGSSGHKIKKGACIDTGAKGLRRPKQYGRGRGKQNA